MNGKLTFNPPVIAHRGASAYAPENTMQAFVKAAQLGIKWLEFDVMLTSDKVPVIFHDETLNRTTNGVGELAHHPYAYLRGLDAGAWFDLTCAGEKIPSLEEILYFLENTQLAANVEMKAPLGQEEALVKQVLAVISPYLKQGTFPILFSSFSIPTLEYLRKYAPNCMLGLLMHEWHPEWETFCQSLKCVSVHVNEAILTEQRAREIKAKGKILLSYTVNDPKRAQQLFAYGVDAVFSDIPDQIFYKSPLAC